MAVLEQRERACRRAPACTRPLFGGKNKQMGGKIALAWLIEYNQ